MAEDNSSVPLDNPSEESPQIPERRIRNASEGRKIYHNLVRADEQRAFHRARHQAMADGEPPFDHAVLVKNGQGSTTNVNWGGAKQVMRGMMSGAVDMNVSVERLARLPIRKAAIPDNEQRANQENILSEEFTRAVRGWEGYNPAYQNLARNCFGHGVGIAYFEDAWDWRFETTGLGDFVIPNGTKSSESRIPVAACCRYMELHELYGCIRNEKNAATMGWNIPAVKKAIMNASPEARGRGWSTSGWMAVQESIRGNDLGFSLSGKTSKVGVIHLWVQEFDGTVSKYLCTLNQLPKTREEDEPWLYERRNVYPEMRRGMVFFTYGIGEHGTFHSISGILRDIFPQENAINRTQCRMLDAAVIGAGLVIQPLEERYLSRMNLNSRGGGLTIAPAKEHGEIIARPMPDVAHGLSPIIQDLRSTVNQRAGQFQGDSPLQDNREKTRFEVAAQLESLGKVGQTQSNLWGDPWVRLLREVARRICRKNYSKNSPGGKEAEEFRRRLVERGFPVEQLEHIDFDSITAERAVGAGSGAARMGRLELLRDQAGEMDDVGRYNMNRDICAARLDGDYDLASRYFPPLPGNRPPVDTKLAKLENNDMARGQDATVEPNDLHLAHLDAHVPFLVQMVESIESGEAQMDDLVEPMVIVHAHATEHLEEIQDAPTIEQKVAQYRQILQQLGEIVQNAMRKAIADQQKAMEQEQEEGGEQGGPSPALQEKMIAARLKLDAMQAQAVTKMEIEQDRHEQKLGHRQQEFQQKMVMQDAQSSASLLAKSREQLAQAGMKIKQEKIKTDALEKREAAKIAAARRKPSSTTKKK